MTMMIGWGERGTPLPSSRRVIWMRCLNAVVRRVYRVAIKRVDLK